MMLRMNPSNSKVEEWQDCIFCGLDVDIDDNLKWDFKKALVAIEEKYPAIKEGEYYWACMACQKIMDQKGLISRSLIY